MLLWHYGSQLSSYPLQQQCVHLSRFVKKGRKHFTVLLQQLVTGLDGFCRLAVKIGKKRENRFLPVFAAQKTRENTSAWKNRSQWKYILTKFKFSLENTYMDNYCDLKYSLVLQGRVSPIVKKG